MAERELETAALARLVFEQPEEFGPRNQQLATEGAARAQLSTLNQPIDAEVVNAEEAGRLVD